MSVRLCKYECGTPISWDTKQNKFIEPENDNRIHDRGRCESLRPTQQEQRPPPQQARYTSPLQKTEILAGNNWQIPREDWQKVLELLTKISENISLMTDHYDGLVEQQRLLTRMVTKPLDEHENENKKLRAQEIRYDQDREQEPEGFA